LPKDDELRLDECRTFYDPHPVSLHFRPFIPAEIKAIVLELDGQRLPLREAINRLQAATKGYIRVDIAMGSLYWGIRAKNPYSNKTFLKHEVKILRFKYDPPWT